MFPGVHTCVIPSPLACTQESFLRGRMWKTWRGVCSLCLRYSLLLSGLLTLEATRYENICPLICPSGYLVCNPAKDMGWSFYFSALRKEPLPKGLINISFIQVLRSPCTWGIFDIIQVPWHCCFSVRFENGLNRTDVLGWAIRLRWRAPNPPLWSEVSSLHFNSVCFSTQPR